MFIDVHLQFWKVAAVTPQEGEEASFHLRYGRSAAHLDGATVLSPSEFAVLSGENDFVSLELEDDSPFARA